MGVDTTFKLRRGLAKEWLYVNPILKAGEPGVEVRPGGSDKMKIGDGVHRWSDLDYIMGDVSTDGSFDDAVLAHILSDHPHPVYDDGPTLDLLYWNATV